MITLRFDWSLFSNCARKDFCDIDCAASSLIKLGGYDVVFLCKIKIIVTMAKLEDAHGDPMGDARAFRPIARNGGGVKQPGGIQH
jgi:hypothetical protein